MKEIKGMIDFFSEMFKRVDYSLINIYCIMFYKAIQCFTKQYKAIQRFIQYIETFK
jgi:hypothetical protein